MIRRDRENRELRKRITNRRKDNSSNAILGQKIDYSKISRSDLEQISKNTQEKKQNDHYIMMRNMMIALVSGIIFIGFIIFILRKTGIL